MSLSLPCLGPILAQDPWVSTRILCYTYWSFTEKASLSLSLSLITLGMTGSLLRFPVLGLALYVELNMASRWHPGPEQGLFQLLP